MVRGRTGWWRFLVVASCAWLVTATVRGEAPSAERIEFFEKRIRPVLVQHCYECHAAQSEKLQGKLRLDSRDGILKGGESGPGLVPGDADASLLVQALRYENYEMPPKGKLPPAVIADFEQWIKNGAIDPRDEGPSPVKEATIDFAAAREFWSFQRPHGHPRPAVRNPNWERTKVDAFLLARLDEAGLEPASAADRRTWLRRVTFDLTGLPPTPEEIAAFEADRSPGAPERIVDGLLASPQYGARMARVWLDLARYAEDQAHIVGKDESLFYPNAYLYRDWVITALNGDVPYDQFVRLQLAADLFEGDDSPNVTALGFIGLGPKYYSRRSLQVMSDEWEDRVDIVGRGLLGLTVACARCHDHKFDPIGTEDYYALAGIFASTAMFNRPLKTDVETAGEGQKDDKEFENGKKAKGEAKDPKQSMHIVREGTPNDLHVFIRGNVENKGPVVQRHFLRILCEGEPENFSRGSGSGRRELAEAIASPLNPLTARVIVNRMWSVFFGRPLAATASNFGRVGERPTHPELLDDLAVRFMEAGWSLKWLSRQIVLSAAYGQSSQVDDAAFAADPENRLLGRMSRRRMTVEQWRDSVLSATGNLDYSVGGPSLDPQDPQQRRRTVYSRASRLELNKLLVMFDYPDPNVHADRRVETTTPLQKMFVLNSRFMVEQAEALASRLCSEVSEIETSSGEDVTRVDRQRIEGAYRLLYGRPATEAEIELGLEFLARNDLASGTPSESQVGGLNRWQRYAHVLLAANELLFID